MSTKIGQFEWKTTSFKMPAGGHIHLEIPEEIYNSQAKQHTLNHHLSTFYLPILLSEDIKNVAARQRTTYGHIGDFHVNSFPGHQFSFELRTPTAEWMTTPKVAQATLAYIATVHNEALNHPRSFTKLKDINVANQDMMRMLEEIGKTRYPLFVNLLMRQIKSAIKTFELYPQFKSEINFLLNSERMLAEKNRFDFDILKGWRINVKAPTAKMLKNKAMVERRVSKLDQRNFNAVNFQLFSWNDDYRINEFATELTKRIHAFTWKLKHKYCFFGLRKGYKEVIVCSKDYKVFMGPDELKSDETIRTKVYTAFKKMMSRFGTSQPDIYYVGIPYEMRRGKKAMDRFIDLMQYLERHLPEDMKKSTPVADLKNADFDYSQIKEPSPPSPVTEEVSNEEEDSNNDYDIYEDIEDNTPLIDDGQET
jgi:hypothetical protein